MCFNSFDGCFPGRGELSRESDIGEVKKNLTGKPFAVVTPLNHYQNGLIRLVVDRF